MKNTIPYLLISSRFQQRPTENLVAESAGWKINNERKLLWWCSPNVLRRIYILLFFSKHTQKSSLPYQFSWWEIKWIIKWWASRSRAANTGKKKVETSRRRRKSEWKLSLFTACLPQAVTLKFSKFLPLARMRLSRECSAFISAEIHLKTDNNRHWANFHAFYFYIHIAHALLRLPFIRFIHGFRTENHCCVVCAW